MWVRWFLKKQGLLAALVWFGQHSHLQAVFQGTLQHIGYGYATPLKP